MSLDTAKMSATELANATGIGKSDISNYTKGKYMPKQDRVFLMARALGVDPVWLYALDVKYTLEAQPNVATSEEAIACITPIHLSSIDTDEKIDLMLEGMLKLSQDDRQRLLDMARIMFPTAF